MKELTLQTLTHVIVFNKKNVRRPTYQGLAPSGGIKR